MTMSGINNHNNNNNNNIEEEWTVVTARDKKRVMRKKGGRRRLPGLPLLSPPQHNNNDGDLSHGGGHHTLQSIDECVQECIQYLCHSTAASTSTATKDHRLWQTTLSLLHDPAFPHRPIDEMVCFGIGNFSKGRPSYVEAPLWQLSFALALRDELKCAKICFYDPVTLPLEREYLLQQQQQQQSGISCCTVLETNHRGRYKAPQGRTVLFFLPHCPRRLYENVLRENWGGSMDLCLIGNSLERLVASCNYMPCTRLLLPYCWTTTATTTASTSVLLRNSNSDEVRRAPGNLAGAFNDTYLCWIRAQSVPWSELECPPAVAYDDVDCELL